MQIIIVEKEIHEAIRAYVGAQGIRLEGKKLDIDLTAGRGTSGFSASIDIVADNAITTKDAEVKLSSSGGKAKVGVGKINLDTPVKTDKVDPKAPLFAGGQNAKAPV